MSAWVFGGQSLIPKVAYDAAWIGAGGVVGTRQYRMLLAALGSTIVTVNPGLPDEFQAVNTPTTVLTAYTDDWLTLTTTDTFCPRSISAQFGL